MKLSSSKPATACLAAACLACAASGSRADVTFGYRLECSATADAALEFSRKARFFATTDYVDTGRDWDSRTRAKAIERPGVFPRYYQPWTGSGARTLVGVQFDTPPKPNFPGQFDRFSNGVPLFTSAVIQWKENVPLPNSWAACIRKPDGSLVKIDADAGKKIYPSDRTTVEFPPTPLAAFMVGLKGTEDGLANYADIENILLYLAPPRSSLTNNLVVWQPGFCMAAFSASVPGVIEALRPVNSYFISHHSLYYDSTSPYGLFRRITPFIQYNGAVLLPAARDCPVTVTAADETDMLAYTLAFNVPGEKPVEVEVTSAFRQSADKSVEIGMRAGSLPAGARLGCRFYGGTNLFEAAAEAGAAPAGPAVTLSTRAGRVIIRVPADAPLAIVREPGSNTAASAFGKADKIRFETVAPGRDLRLAISLPTGAAGQPQPATLPYAWRPSLAGEGDAGLAPFTQADLELVDDIDCGNPDDPHPCFDVSNDPAIPALRKRYGTIQECAGQDKPYGYLAFLDKPGEAAVPVTTVAGRPCREIPNKFGAYFRYNLKTPIQWRTPYLVVVDHAFDRKRRGEFHSIYLDKDNNLQYGSVLWGALETGDTPENAYKTESIFCYGPLNRGEASVSSIVFSGVYSIEGDREDGPGPAIRRIRIYRVKTLPALPDFAALAPPRERRRSLLCLTELVDAPNPLWLFMYPKLVGYDGIWTYNEPTSRFFGGSDNVRVRWVSPGSLAANRQLFEAAAAQGLFVNVHLGALLKMGYGPGDADSFTAGGHGTYAGERIPLKPTPAELDRIAKALGKALAVLAPYSSLKEIAVINESPMTARNLRDFCAATGAALTPSPVETDNSLAIHNAGPDMVKRWRQWACAERFAFLQWLLKEARKYCPDLTITMNRGWWWGPYGSYENPVPEGPAPISREPRNFFNSMKGGGIDPDLYAGQPGFSLELDAIRWLRPPGRGWPDLYTRDWFPRVRDDFKAGGLSIMVNLCYEESSKPLRAYSCLFMCSREKFRKGLIDAMRFANARTIHLPTYNEPWSGHIDDLREFVVPYRLLPFAEPEPFGGKLTDTASQAVINKYADRFGLINAGGKDTVAELELPPGKTVVTDLSEGIPQALESFKNKEGKPAVRIAMESWSLKTLEIK